MKITPITVTDAKLRVLQWHKHHKPPMGGLFAVAVAGDSGEIIGVAIAGRPVARHLMNGSTIEITRVAVDREAQENKNACSMLYGAIRRAGTALGYARIVTYTLESEPGTSLRAAGFRAVSKTQESQGWLSHPKVSTVPPIIALSMGKTQEELHFPNEPKIRWEWP